MYLDIKGSSGELRSLPMEEKDPHLRLDLASNSLCITSTTRSRMGQPPTICIPKDSLLIQVGT